MTTHHGIVTTSIANTPNQDAFVEIGAPSGTKSTVRIGSAAPVTVVADAKGFAVHTFQPTGDALVRVDVPVTASVTLRQRAGGTKTLTTLPPSPLRVGSEEKTFHVTASQEGQSHVLIGNPGSVAVSLSAIPDGGPPLAIPGGGTLAAGAVVKVVLPVAAHVIVSASSKLCVVLAVDAGGKNDLSTVVSMD